MHFQYYPKAECKIVKCIRGKLFDVMVDIRKNSPTFLKWHGEILTDDNFKIIYVPEGFAHGFQSLTDNCEALYFNTEFYDKSYESGICYNDPLINIKWLLELSDISEKDRNQKLIDKNNFGV